MCALCVEILKGKMTVKEMASAYVEIMDDDAHSGEVLALIEKQGGVDEIWDVLYNMAADYGDGS